MATISIKLDEKLLGLVDSLAEKKQISRSEAVRQALMEYTAGAQAQYSSIPQEVKDKIEFLELLVTEGKTDDFGLIKSEVAKLWMSVQ